MQIELNELLDLVGPKYFQSCAKPVPDSVPQGDCHIVIANRGFVWVGQTTVKGDFCTISNAKNIRIWGTTKGLGELKDGPTSSTKTDDCGAVVVPMRAVIAFIKCNQNW